MFSVRGLFLDPPASLNVTPATFSVWLTALLYCGHRFLLHLLLQTHLSPTQPPESDPDRPKDGNIIDLQGGGQGGLGDFWRPAGGYTKGTQGTTQRQAKCGPHLPWRPETVPCGGGRIQGQADWAASVPSKLQVTWRSGDHWSLEHLPGTPAQWQLPPARRTQARALQPSSRMFPFV